MRRKSVFCGVAHSLLSANQRELRRWNMGTQRGSDERAPMGADGSTPTAPEIANRRGTTGEAIPSSTGTESEVALPEPSVVTLRQLVQRYIAGCEQNGAVGSYHRRAWRTLEV